MSVRFCDARVACQAASSSAVIDAGGIASNSASQRATASGSSDCSSPAVPGGSASLVLSCANRFSSAATLAASDSSVIRNRIDWFAQLSFGGVWLGLNQKSKPDAPKEGGFRKIRL